MARREALVTPKMLIWARERISMSTKLAAEVIGVKEEKYLSWEQGEKLPTVNQAKKFANKVKIPYAWFFLDAPPKKYRLPKNTDYRTFSNQSILLYSLELQYLLADVSMRRDAMIELYNQMDIPVSRFDQYLDIKTNDNDTIAQAIRNLLGITLERQKKFKNSYEAYNYYVEALSRIGILVFQAAKIDKVVMRGMSIYDPIFPIIVVNRKDEYNARIFTLMHEFVHILTRTPGICDTIDLEMQSHFEIEIRCNRIAAEVLVPTNALLSNSQWIEIQKNGWDDYLIQKISKVFSVSREVIIGRLMTLGKIENNFYYEKLLQYTHEYEEYERKKNKKNGFLPQPKDICSQVGKLYARTVMSAYNQELITPRDASQFFSGLKVQHFDKVERWCFS
jgi:Zn-dependent peptidase ImmA (M78 family)/DNA-binding XRE family transcriptional regulator